MFNGIDVGWSSIPSLADLDGDNDLDLLVGAEDGIETRYSTNDGNNVFTINTSTFSTVTFPNYRRPTLADIDNDDDYDLVIGSIWGDLTYYRNEGNRTTPIWVRADSMFAGIEVDQSSSPGFADLDGDGRKDMIIGEYTGNFTYYKNLFSPVTDVEDGATKSIPDEFVLYQNYPNPFNPNTKIRYTIPTSPLNPSPYQGEGNRERSVTLKVYDLLGREIASLVDEEKPAGSYEIEFDASRLSSGVYFYALRVNGTAYSKSMILMK